MWQTDGTTVVDRWCNCSGVSVQCGNQMLQLYWCKCTTVQVNICASVHIASQARQRCRVNNAGMLKCLLYLHRATSVEEQHCWWEHGWQTTSLPQCCIQWLCCSPDMVMEDDISGLSIVWLQMCWFKNSLICSVLEDRCCESGTNMGNTANASNCSKTFHHKADQLDYHQHKHKCLCKERQQ